jgi:hypothetical protein
MSNIKLYVLENEAGEAKPVTINNGFIIGKDAKGRSCPVSALGFDPDRIPEHGVIMTMGKRWSKIPFTRTPEGINK